MPRLTKAASLTKRELVEIVHKSGVANGLSKKATEAVVSMIFDAIERNLRKGKKFTYPGFGTFNRVVRKKRKGHNPQTGERLTIPRTTTIKFTPAQALKDALNRRG